MLKWVESHLGHYKYQNTDEKWTLVDQGRGKNGLTLKSYHIIFSGVYQDPLRQVRQMERVQIIEIVIGKNQERDLEVK